MCLDININIHGRRRWMIWCQKDIYHNNYIFNCNECSTRTIYIGKHLRLRWYQVLDSVFGVLLSLDMLYPQIISHCIDDDMMAFDYESVFRSSVRDAVLWVVRLVSFEKMTLSCIITFGYVVSTDNISLHRR